MPSSHRGPMTLSLRTALVLACVLPASGALAQTTAAPAAAARAIPAAPHPSLASLSSPTGRGPYSAQAMLQAPFMAGARLFALDASGALTVRDNNGRGAPH